MEPKELEQHIKSSLSFLREKTYQLYNDIITYRRYNDIITYRRYNDIITFNRQQPKNTVDLAIAQISLGNVYDDLKNIENIINDL